MVTIYGFSGMVSTRNAQRFLKDLGVPYVFKNLQSITFQEVLYLAKRAYGINHLVATKSKFYDGYQALVEKEDTTLFQLYRYIVDHPKILKSPIIYDEHRFEVGFGEHLRCFIPREMRKKELHALLDIAWKEFPIRDEEVTLT